MQGWPCRDSRAGTATSKQPFGACVIVAGRFDAGVARLLAAVDGTELTRRTRQSSDGTVHSYGRSFAGRRPPPSVSSS